jgi:Fur family ferric uptake transcriptional regulator
VQRKTRQKQAIQAVFADAAGPLGPHGVATAAREAVPGLGIATVYRSIKELVTTGWLVSVATPAGARFEVAAGEHHHHFFCNVCTRTFDLDGCVGGFDQLVPAGFLGVLSTIAALLGVGQYEVTVGPIARSVKAQGEREGADIVTIEELATQDLTDLRTATGERLLNEDGSTIRYNDDGKLTDDPNLAAFVHEGMRECLHFNGPGFCNSEPIE